MPYRQVICSLLQPLLPHLLNNTSRSRFSPHPETTKIMKSGVGPDFTGQVIKVYDVMETSTMTCWLVFDSLAVVVEDSSSSCCVTVKVFPHMTTAVLKQQVRLEIAHFLCLI